MLIWVFGPVVKSDLIHQDQNHAEGFLQLGQARVNWFLSIDETHVPEDAKKAGKRTFRSLKLEGKEIEFSEGFTDLHTKSYSEILAGRGFGIRDARPSIDLVYSLRKN